MLRQIRLTFFMSLLLAATWAAAGVRADSAESITIQPAAPERIPPSCPAPEPRALLAGDSWAQFMWDDNSHNDIFDRFGHADKTMISESRGGTAPGPGYTGSEYAVSGSEAREWADTAHYPYITNMEAALTANPTLDSVVLSIGGNDVIAGKSDGGWYKNMDLAVAGSEAALFSTIETNTLTVVDAILSARPEIETLVSSYDYPNFNVSNSFPFYLCDQYACPKRDDLSLDPDNDLITDAELNGLMILVENKRLDWINANPRIFFDNSIGLMHHYYGDGVAEPGVLPKPGGTPPTYAPLPGGNPNSPSLRSNFRPVFGFSADPIHLDFDGYQYKIAHQAETYFFPKYRGTPSATFASQGGMNDGWTDGNSVGSAEIRVGENGTNERYFGLISIDTADIPDGAEITSASLYLQRNGGNDISPFELSALGQPILAVKRGTFGALQVEPLDATTVPTANDVGCFHGTAKDDFYAVRVDLLDNGLTAINKQGVTQFRIAFPDIDSTADDPSVFFMGGSSSPMRGEDRIIEREKVILVPQPDGSTVEETIIVRSIQHQGIAEVLGSTAPILDVTYTIPTAVTASQPQAAQSSVPLVILILITLGLLWQTTRIYRKNISV